MGKVLPSGRFGQVKIDTRTFQLKSLQAKGMHNRWAIKGGFELRPGS